MKMSSLAMLVLLSGMSTQAQAQTYSKTETITYYDNTAKWVLGQTASVACNISVPASTACNGDVVSSTTFDTTYGLPLKTYSFGKLQQSVTYDTTSLVDSGQRGTLKTVSDGRDTSTYNTTITFTGWKRGIPQNIAYPDGTTQSAIVDNNGWISSVTNEAGFTTAYGYDAMGRLASINHPDETSPALTYNNTTISFVPVAATEYGITAGHWRQIVDTGNARQVTYFDAMWRPLVEDRYDEGNVAGTRSVTAKRYDVAGRLAFQSYPRASITSYADAALTGTDTLYDALGRVTSVSQDNEIDPTQPLITATAYLSGTEGPYTRVTNPRGYQTRIWHQAFDQPSTEHPVEIRGPEGTFTTIARDPFGKPTSIRRHNSTDTVGITRSYAYNAYQELCRAVEPETGATLMGYDAAGNLAWSASGLPASTACDPEGDTATILARKTIRSHDQRNRISTLSFPNGLGDTTYDYTADGLLASISALNDGIAVNHYYTYNHRRLLTNEELLYGNINWNVGHGYNTNGHLSSDTYPTGLAIAYAPNALGQPTQAGSYASGVTHHPNGAIKQFTYGNGIVHTMTQNTRQLPDTSLDAYGTKKFLSDGYDYDGNGNVVAISDGATDHVGRMDRDMTYDGLDRLKTVASPMFGPEGASYAYDVLDNLTRVDVDNGGPNSHPRNHYYCYDQYWLLTNVKNTPCSEPGSVIGLDYDVQGNLSAKNGTTYAFDFGNRLREVNPEGTTAPNITYTYDGHGRRARDLVGTSGYRISFYTQGGQLAFTRDGRSGKYTNYVYLGGSLVAMREWPQGTSAYTTKYQHTDALGSPVVVTDSSRAVLERSEYEPYGQVLNRPVSDGPGYTGHVTDAATGLVYAQQRYYDPMIGRFLSVDPVTADGATGANFNRYKYASNNPYRFIDPDGRYECTASKAQCGTLAKAVGRIHEAAKKAPADSRVAQVSKLLGTPGEKNGVTISGHLSDKRNLGEATSDGKNVHIGLNFGKLSTTDKLASVAMHEGSHGVDHRTPLGDEMRAASRTASEITEIGASTAQGRMFEALNSNEPFGLFTTEGGMNWEKINDQAQRSVNATCPTPTSCSP